MFGWTRGKVREARSAVMEGASFPASEGVSFLKVFGMDGGLSSGQSVTIETALGVPSVFCAVEFLSGSLASLPLHVFKREGEEANRDEGALEVLLNEAPNEGMSSFDWRKYSFEQTFTGGRQVTFIERNKAHEIIALWPLDPTETKIKRTKGVKRYVYNDGGKVRTYNAAEIIDLPFMLQPDLLQHRSPLLANAEVIGMAQAATEYGGSYFRGGGVPPFVVEGTFESVRSMQRAADDLEAAVRKAAKEKRQALVLPQGLTVKTIGTDAEKAQLIETQRFLIEQVARIYQLPPVFLQDLTHGTFANTEQQDLHLVKHTLHRWVKQFEGELNLKLFGQKDRSRFVRVNMDGLLRGDFKTRMDGFSAAIQHGVMTPNEARALEGRSGLAGGGRLYVQGAMVPIEEAGKGQGGGNGS